MYETVFLSHQSPENVENTVQFKLEPDYSKSILDSNFQLGNCLEK